MYRILIDCTSTLDAAFQSGIQRVVRNLIDHGPTAMTGKASVEAFVFGTKQMFQASKKLYEKRHPASQHGGRWVIDRELSTRQRSLQKLPSRLRSIVYPRRVARIVRNWRLQQTRPRILPGSGDIVLLADATWRLTAWDAVKEARERGAKIGSVVYDLIPITHGELAGEALRLAFIRWLTAAQEHSDFFLTISQATTDALHEFQDSNGWLRKPTLSFRLGSSMGFEPGGTIRDCIRRLFEHSNAERLPTFVMVGTLAPHKNHTTALEAFERIWKQRIRARLMIVGHRGWNVDALLGRLRHHPYWGSQLIGIDDASDSELQYIYQKMDALIFASRAEGFGLPIVEALSQNRKVIASDIPVHREVAGDLVSYFDANDSVHLRDAIVETLAMGSLPQRTVDNRVAILDWPAAAKMALQKCIDLAFKSHSEAKWESRSDIASLVARAL